MSFKNEKSKIYTFGIMILGIATIISNAILLIRHLQTPFLISISQLSLILFMMLLGTREVVAKRNKMGYLNYMAAIFMSIVLIMRVFNI